MARLCARTKLSTASLTVLFVIYFAALMASSAAETSPYKAHLLTQATNVTALASVLGLVAAFNRQAGCSGRWTWSWVTFAVLAGNLLARSIVAATRSEQANLQAKFTRWDTAAVAVGIVAVLTELYYAVVPRRRLRTTFFALGLVFVLPLVSAVPSLFKSTKPDALKLSAALTASQEAYVSFDGKDHQTRVMAVSDGGTVFLAFAGTETTQDAKIDASIGDIRVPPDWLLPGDASVRAHRGFVKLYAEIRPKVLKLAEAAGPSRAIVLCGHSLGGALATLAALDLASKPHGGAAARIHMYSFGAPQVGDAAFVTLFDARVPHVARVVNPFDPVPRSLSAQLVHTKGYYAVTSLNQDSPLTAHNLTTYAIALQRPGWMRVAGLFAPLVYLGLAVGLVLVAQMAWSRVRAQ